MITAVSATRPHRLETHTWRGGILIDDTAASTPVEVRSSLRVLAELGRGARTIAVVGELDVADDDRLEAHDALGRIVVRLDISQLVVVGDGARHLHAAAGLEGSWDGESVLVSTPDTAYDFVRATSGEEAVMLITGGARCDLLSLVSRLREDSL